MTDITWTNTRVRLGDLIPWSRNPKTISKQHATRLLALWDKLGQFQTIAIGPDMGVYDGHQRLNVLMAAHGKDYEVDARQSSRALTEKEREELVVAAHVGTVGQFDWEQLSGWDAPELIAWGMDDTALKDWKQDVSALSALLESEKQEVDAEPQIDRAAELNEKWQVKTGDLWQIGSHRLLCGDSTVKADVDRVMVGEKARLVWTDPPYGVNYGEKLEAANPMGYRVRTIENDDLSPDKLEEFLRGALSNVADVCSAGAAIYVACPAGTLLPSLIASFDGSGFQFRWGLIWLKDQIVLSRADYHFKHENILYGWKPDGAHYFTDDRTQSSVFEYPRPKSSEEHPTMKPIELIQNMLRNSSERGDTVIDVFGGSGSTMLACENEKRVCRMVELAPNYCAVILERMTSAFPGIEIKRIDVS